MPTISIFDGIKISMFYREHQPPHFHAERGDEEAEVSIDPIMILEENYRVPCAPKCSNGPRSIKRNCAPTGIGACRPAITRDRTAGLTGVCHYDHSRYRIKSHW